MPLTGTFLKDTVRDHQEHVTAVKEGKIYRFSKKDDDDDKQSGSRLHL